MINKLKYYFLRSYYRQYISLALARGGATAATRIIDPSSPITWEFSSFSQNGEDGIIDYLTRNLNSSNHYFMEIGASNGLENNSSWLAVARKYSGLMIEGDKNAADICDQFVAQLNLCVDVKSLFVRKENIDTVLNLIEYREPDVVSIDIDGNDYYISDLLINNGIFPKIFVVEYNSTFGPNKSITIPYREDFNYIEAHPSHLYFGVSIAAWRRFFEKHGYSFVTVDSSGTNAFFINSQYFSPDFIYNIKGIMFHENFYQYKKFRSNWKERFKMISHLLYRTIE